MSIEDFNYWNDSRTIAGMVEKPRIQETKNGVHILFETEDDDGIVTVHWLKTKWEVCATCDGNGKHVNQSIDCCGLTQEDFDQDPGFEEDYFSGVHDVTCTECKGKRVVPVVCETDPNFKEYQQYQDELYNDARESAAERARGA